jgi:hypothetical protein
MYNGKVVSVRPESTQKLSSKFNFCWHWSNISVTLHQADTELFCVSKKLLISRNLQTKWAWISKKFNIF